MDKPARGVVANKVQEVARRLLDRIVQLDLRPGSLFGTETEILEQFDVSRPTLRESLRILRSQGVLSLRPGPRGGIIVSKPSIEMLAENLSVFLRLHNLRMKEILRARMAIEPTLARDAAVNGDESHFEEIEQAIKLMLAAPASDVRAISKLRFEFFNIIARAAANPVLEVFWQTTMTLAAGESQRLKLTSRSREQVAVAYRQILQAMRERDGEKARLLMEDYIHDLELALQGKDR